jgi:hypothetical protein
LRMGVAKAIPKLRKGREVHKEHHENAQRHEE